jgi:hypothetical protein
MKQQDIGMRTYFIILFILCSSIGSSIAGITVSNHMHHQKSSKMFKSLMITGAIASVPLAVYVASKAVMPEMSAGIVLGGGLLLFLNEDADMHENMRELLNNKFPFITHDEVLDFLTDELMSSYDDQKITSEKLYQLQINTKELNHFLQDFSYTKEQIQLIHKGFGNIKTE